MRLLGAEGFWGVGGRGSGLEGSMVAHRPFRPSNCPKND
jgi:hypothetical protein